jgi:hypothetical protein
MPTPQRAPRRRGPCVALFVSRGRPEPNLPRLFHRKPLTHSPRVRQKVAGSVRTGVAEKSQGGTHEITRLGIASRVFTRATRLLDEYSHPILRSTRVSRAGTHAFTHDLNRGVRRSKDPEAAAVCPASWGSTGPGSTRRAG